MLFSGAPASLLLAAWTESLLDAFPGDPITPAHTATGCNYYYKELIEIVIRWQQ